MRVGVVSAHPSSVEGSALGWQAALNPGVAVWVPPPPILHFCLLEARVEPRGKTHVFTTRGPGAEQAPPLGFEQPDGIRDWVPGEQRSGSLRSRFPSPHLPRWSRLGLGTRRSWQERAIKTLTKRQADSTEEPWELRSLDRTLSLSRVGGGYFLGRVGIASLEIALPGVAEGFQSVTKGGEPGGPGRRPAGGWEVGLPQTWATGWGPAVPAVTRAGGVESDWCGGRRRGREGGEP